MPRQPARRDQHQVESHREAGQIGARQNQRFGGASDAPTLPRRHRMGGGDEFFARLDLDDRHGPPAARDDPPAAQPKMPQTEPLGPTAAALGQTAGRGVATSAAPNRAGHRARFRIASARRYSIWRGNPDSTASWRAASRTPSAATASWRRRSISSSVGGAAGTGGPTTITISPRGEPASS